jgi:hypothetical protein
MHQPHGTALEVTKKQETYRMKLHNCIVFEFDTLCNYDLTLNYLSFRTLT